MRRQGEPAQDNGNNNHEKDTLGEADIAAVGEQVSGRIADLLQRYHQHVAAFVTEQLRESDAAGERRFETLGGKLTEGLSQAFDKQARGVQGLLGKAFMPLADRITGAVKKDAESHWSALHREMTEVCSVATQRSALKPVVDQLFALYDRINDEKAFLGAWYRKDPELALHVGARQLQERSQSTIGSFAAEIQMILRGIGVEMIEGVCGPFNPQFQKVVGVEPAPRPELDGHVARVVRAGFVWNGTLLRPENITVYKNGAQKS